MKGSIFALFEIFRSHEEKIYRRLEPQTEIVSESEETCKCRIFFQTNEERINIGKVTRTMEIVERYFSSSLSGIFPRKTIALEKWTSIFAKVKRGNVCLGVCPSCEFFWLESWAKQLFSLLTPQFYCRNQLLPATSFDEGILFFHHSTNFKYRFKQWPTAKNSRVASRWNKREKKGRRRRKEEEISVKRTIVWTVIFTFTVFRKLSNPGQISVYW